MMQSANMGVVPGAMPVQGPGQGPVPVGQGPVPVPVGPPGKLQTALHTVLTCFFFFGLCKKVNIQSVCITMTLK